MSVTWTLTSVLAGLEMRLLAAVGLIAAAAVAATPSGCGGDKEQVGGGIPKEVARYIDVLNLIRSTVKGNGSGSVHCFNSKVSFPGVYGSGAVSFGTVEDFCQKYISRNRWFFLHNLFLIHVSFPMQIHPQFKKPLV
jgi:hypothetical protein